MGRSGRLAIGAIVAAIAAGEMAPRHLLGAAAFVLAAMLLVRELRPAGRWITAVPALIGAVLIAVRVSIGPAGPGPVTAPPDGDGPWSLVVRSTGSPRDGEQVVTLVTPPSVSPAIEVAASLPRYPVVVPGDRIVVEGAIRPPPDSPYGEYLRRIGAIGTLRSRTLEIEPAPEDPARRLEGLRRSAAEALALVLPEPEAGLAAGILIGLRDLVDRDLAAAFTTAGVSHVVAISGWNIAIVAAAVAAATGQLGRRRRSVVTILAISAYVAFAGGSASVVRAALMAGVVLLARETGRAGRATAALGWAATILLLLDPGLVLDAGFQLSSLATAGLIAWGTPLSERIHAMGRGRIPRVIAEGLGISLAAQAATLPVILVSFGRLAVLSPVVNLLVVPLVAPAMAAGVAALMGGALVLAGGPPVLGAVVAAPAWVILRILVTIVDGAAAVPFASVTLVAPFDVLAAVAAAVGVAALTWCRRPVGRPSASTDRAAPLAPRAASPGSGAAVARPRQPATGTPSSRRLVRASTIALTVAALVAGGVVAARPTSVPRVSILDVGQGDAILVEGSHGGRLLIDGGPDPGRLLVDLDQRVPPWDRRIDAVVLTHPHEDHVAGLGLLLDRYHVGRVFEPGMIGPGPGYAAWSRRLAGLVTVPRQGLAAGDRLAVDEIRFSVLWPIRGQVPLTPPDGGTGINNVSIVLLGEVGSRRMLLMGDVEEGVDPSLLRDRLPHVDLLKVAHHGSKTATTQAFVDAVRPSVAVASAGAGNPYGHPAKATLDRLAAAGARVLRTDRDGTVVVAFEPEGMSVHPEGASRSTGQSSAPASRAVMLTSARAVAGDRIPRAPAFRCAIPVTGLLPELGPGSPPPVPAIPAALTREPGRATTVGYHRPDDGARAGGGRLPPPLPRPSRLAGAARTRRRRGRRLAGGTHRGQWHPDRPPARRDCRAPPRCRQEPAGRRSGEGTPAWRGLGRVAGGGRPSGAGTGRHQPSGDVAARRRSLPTMGRVRVARGADRGLRRQASRATPRIDGRPLRRLGPAAPGQVERCRAASGQEPRGPPRGRRLPGGRHRTERRSPARMDRTGVRGGAGHPAPADRRGFPEDSVTTPTLAFFWGDDELSAARALDRFQADLEISGGAPMERWSVRGDRSSAAGIVAAIMERIATPVLFGGGTFAVVTNAGGLVVRNEDRDAFLAALEVVAPGNALAVVDASQSGAKGPTPKRVADAIAAAGGTVRQFKSPREGALAGWIEAEARERGLTLEPGASKVLAERVGGFVREADAERGQQTRMASMELDKLALYRGDRPIRVEDVRELVVEVVPSSVWAFTDAVAERRVDRALDALEHLFESTPEPVILAVLHRRVRELIETGDRLDAGERLPAIGRAMGVASEFRMERLRDQAKRWTVDELIGALDGLVELDAVVKGAPDREVDEAQRRLAFDLWVIDHAGAGRSESG